MSKNDGIFFVSYVLWLREFIPTSHKCVTFTVDLETQGHMISYMTFTNFGCVCPKTMEFFFVFHVLWLREFIPASHKCVTSTVELENSRSYDFVRDLYQLWLWLSKNDGICFVSKGFWVGEFISTSHKYVTFTVDLKTQGHLMLYVTFTNTGCACRKTMEFFWFLMIFRSGK